jgi:APA family basic amino acid/polyamine antiporter
MSDSTLFVRKASGLVRAWSVFDAFIYATFSINLITLGLYIFSYCYYFEGNLGTAVVVGAVFTVFEVIVYASLISAMPRAGGDYVWQSRVLGRAWGFILAVTGWWFILWLWVPLYGQMLVYEFFTPILAILGAKSAALWFTGSSTGLLVGMIAVCVIVFIYIAIGMKWYARVQKFCFFGLVLVFIMLLAGNNQTFVTNLNNIVPKMFGAQAMDLYQETLKAGEAAGTVVAPLGNIALGASIALLPMMVFFNLWPNWGATLYGEVRGASDFKRNLLGMVMAIIVTTVLALVFFILIAKNIGWDFYNKANGAFWNYTWGYVEEQPPLPFWPYPALFAAFMTTSPILQFAVILLMSLWWFGWSGTVFLSSTRVIFAASFDRMLPEWVSKVSPRTRTPLNALLLMVIPSLIVSALYAYNIFNFQSLALDATLVIAVTFLGSTIAAIILPWRQKELYEGSPISKYRVQSWLSWIVTIIYVVATIYLIFISFRYGLQVLAGLPAVGASGLTWVMVILVWIFNAGNAAVLVWILVFAVKRMASVPKMPLISFTGLIFLAFLDWLLIEWIWDPHISPFDFALYGIGWSNVSSMVFMLAMYGLAAIIFFGFNAYRKKQGIDIEKVYKEIPVE